jgi:hypothetical protein
MVFNVKVIPISHPPIHVTVLTEPTPSSPAFRYIGPWADVRGFLAIHTVSGVEFPDIETELHEDRLVSFDIDTSEMGLASAQFNAVREL